MKDGKVEVEDQKSSKDHSELEKRGLFPGTA